MSADSWTRAALTVWSVAIIYTSRGRCTSGLRRIEGDVRVVFRSWKIFSQSSLQENFADFLRTWMMGRVCLASLGRNLDMAVRRPTRRSTSLTLVELRISIIALNFSGLASILHCLSMKPKNFPLSTLKTHFSGLSLRLYCRRTQILQTGLVHVTGGWVI